MEITYNSNIEALERELKRKNITCFNVALPPNIDDNNSVCFADHNEFISFLKNESIKSIFCALFTNTVEDFCITDNHIKEALGRYAAENLSETVSKAIDKYNLSIEQYEDELKKARHNMYFTLYNGFMVYIILADKVSLADPDEQLIKILNAKQADLEREKAEKELLIDKLQEKLKQDILADSAFYQCTNMNLRRNYGYNLWTKLDEEFEPLKKYWRIHTNLILFVDAIWTEYKNSKK